MPSPNGVTVAGNPGPIRISQQTDVSRTHPVEHRVLWRGERIATESYFGVAANKSTQATYRQDGASGTIDALYRDDEAFVDIVEIDFNSVQRDWWTAPAYASLSESNRVRVLGALADLQNYASEGHTPAEVAAKYNAILASLGAPLNAAFSDVFYNGDTYLALLPVVTWTRTVAPFYSTKFVILDVGKVFSTAAVIGALAAAGVDATDIQFQIAEVTNTVAANSLQTLGWLKMGRRTEASDGGGHYVHQWIFDAYRNSGYIFV